MTTRQSAAKKPKMATKNHKTKTPVPSVLLASRCRTVIKTSSEIAWSSSSTHSECSVTDKSIEEAMESIAPNLDHEEETTQHQPSSSSSVQADVQESFEDELTESDS